MIRCSGEIMLRDRPLIKSRTEDIVRLGVAHVPAGRGPFRSWEEAAIDALANCAPYAARNKDWNIGGALTELERYLHQRPQTRRERVTRDRVTRL